MAAIGIGLGALAIWGLAALPTSFLPIEDQGYLIAAVQLPDGASLERTEQVMDRVAGIVRKTPGVAHAVAIGGISVFDNNATLANAGAMYVILEDWSLRGRGEDLRSLYAQLGDALSKLEDGTSFVLVPPPIQGIGNAARLPDGGRAPGQQLRLREAAERRARRSPRRAAPSPASRPS